MNLFQKRYIPNYLSFLRLLLVPVYLWIFFAVSKPLSAVVLIVCALTDALDGHLARKNGWITDLGKLLDPLADKLASMGALVALSMAELLPWWITSLAILKEVVMIVGAAFILGKKKIVVASVWYGKLATVLFYVVVLALHFFPTMHPVLMTVLHWTLFLSMAGAALLYLFHYVRNLPEKENA
ncbi:MAG: CDP-alcohol phosphatidyltransferase family protein [Clostridia bacterium]|nr:CDP-alcohol phosphatidyltransferase family protein [Clostridia bacterium]